jgi:hypothetical protein
VKASSNGFILDREFLMTKMRISAAVALLVVALVSPQANAANLILNGGFENGTHGINNNVPTDWVSNAAFDNEPSFNNVEMSFKNTVPLAWQSAILMMTPSHN